MNSGNDSSSSAEVGSDATIDYGSSAAIKVMGVGRIKFRAKQFEVRNSMLTTYFEGTNGSGTDPPVAPIRNIFVAAFTLMFLHAMIRDVISGFSPMHHLWLIFWNFEELPKTMLCWLFMALSSLLPYLVLKKWSSIPSMQVSRASAAFLIVLYVIYLFLLFAIPLIFLFWMDLRVACSFIITCENTRIGMKVHSFIRENVPKALQIKRNLMEKETFKAQVAPSFPNINKFIYFFFCPTFVYRDEYAKSTKRSFWKVIQYFAQALLMIYFTNLVCTQIVHPLFLPINYSKITTGEIILSIFPAIIAAILCLMLLFYGLLHCWLNAFAELLQFGDREFYLDWWNSKSMAEYYRKWNLVVHEWLYAYVYRDIALLIGNQYGTKVSQIMVFFLSSAFHEYWFGVALRMCYPVMFTLYFIFGGIFFALSRFIRAGYVWNTLMWGNLLIGTGMFMAFYSQEWYARHRCPESFKSSLLNFIIPRHWVCIDDTYYKYDANIV